MRYLKNNFTIHLIILLAITLFTFLPCLTADFINWDDTAYVTTNPWIKQFSWEAIKKIFTTSFVGVYTPLTMLTYMIEYHFFHLNPSLFHATNLFIHLLNCSLLYWIIFTISKKSFLSFFVVLFFGIHPLRVESVAWITERKDMLCTFFYFFAIVSYLSYIKNDYRLRFYFLSLMLFICSLLSKPMAVSLPFILMLFDYLMTRRYEKRVLLEKLPFLLFSIIFMIIALYSAHAAAKRSFFYTFPDSIFIGFFNILFYLIKTVFPVNLSAFYAYPFKIDGRPPFIFLASPFIVGVFLGSILFLCRHKRYVVFGISFFLITIFPVLQFIPAGHAMAADRFTYIPLTGIFFALVKGIHEFYEGHKTTVRVMPYIFPLVCISTVVMLLLLTWQRCLVWQNSVTLWNDVLKKDPYNIIAYTNLGSHYLFAGDYHTAISLYQKALALNPRYAQAHNNVCSAYLRMQKLDKALQACTQALSLKPDYEDAMINLGKIYHAMGRYSDAIMLFQHIHHINPQNADAYNELCYTYLTLKNFEKALPACQKSLSLNPFNTDTYINLATIHMHERQYKEAIDNYRKAQKINPRSSESSIINLCKAYRATKEYNEALNACRNALTMLPDSVELYNELGSVYLATGDYLKAINMYKNAITIDPSFGAAYNNLAVVYYSLKNYTLAREYITKAMERGYTVHPDFIKLVKQGK